MTQSATMTSGVSIPTDLDSTRAKLIYLYLAAVGGATADELCTELVVTKGTVLSIIGTLRDRGYLERRDGRYEIA